VVRVRQGKRRGHPPIKTASRTGTEIGSHRALSRLAGHGGRWARSAGWCPKVPAFAGCPVGGRDVGQFAAACRERNSGKKSHGPRAVHAANPITDSFDHGEISAGVGRAGLSAGEKSSPGVHHPPARGALAIISGDTKNPALTCSLAYYAGAARRGPEPFFFPHGTTLSEFWRFPGAGIDKGLRRRIVGDGTQELAAGSGPCLAVEARRAYLCSART
jgi:hypothetical protein